MTTRRSLLTQIATLAGSGAVFSAMQTLGLATAAEATPLGKLSPTLGTGRRVAVLGGGIGGLVAALELRRAGFAVTVIEANGRPGGRSWTIRGGTTVELTDGSSQRCDWRPGDYLNAGPGRIPSIHTNLLGYCRDLGVPLEVEVNSSRSGLLQAAGFNAGRPIEQRQAINDTRGFLSELLAKAINRHSLDDALTPDEIAHFLPFLREYGDLDPQYRYVGSRRSGYSVPPAAGPGNYRIRVPLDRAELIGADFSTEMLYEEYIDWQATMLQPVGGMDRIAFALARELGSAIVYDAPVAEMRRSGSGVRIRFGIGAQTRSVDADFAICAMPGQIAKSIPADFSAQTSAALGKVKGDAHFKLAWEAPRFWERNDHLYGGLSFLKGGLIDTVWYPSGGFQSETGVIISGFAQEIDDFGAVTAIGKLSTQGKIAASRAAVELLHPGCGSLLDKPIYLPWHHVPHQLGALSVVAADDHEQVYLQLQEPDGPFYFVGDWLSRLNGWQEGAIFSAHRAVAAIAARVAA